MKTITFTSIIELILLFCTQQEIFRHKETEMTLLKKAFKKIIAAMLSLSMVITMNANVLAAANVSDTNTVQLSENSVVQTSAPGKIMMLKLNEEQAYLNGNMIPTLVYGSGYVSKLIMVNGSTLLPLRFVCECLGFEVGYNVQTNNSTITDTANRVKFELVTGTTEMYKYDLEGNLLATGTATAPTTIIEGVTHVPVRSLLEAMGFHVYWNEAGYVLISENPMTQEQFEDLIASWGKTDSEYPDYNTYTVFSKNTENDINLAVSSTSIKGDVYSGRDFNYSGSILNIDGKADAVGTNNINCNNVTAAAFNNNVAPLDMPQWGEAILKLAEPITEYEGDQAFDDGQMNLEQSVRASGNLEFNGTRFTGQGYVIAGGDIEYTLSALNNNDTYKLAMYSENGDIIINGSDAVVNGILYAPNGKVIFNGSSLTVNGRIFADSIELNGSIFNFIGIPEDWDLIAGGVEKTWTTDKDFAEGSLNNVSQSTADMLTISQKTVTGDEGYIKEYIKTQAKEGVKVKEISDTSYLTASGKNINLSFELSGFGDTENRENPIDFVLLIDVSGSMAGSRIDTAKNSAISVIDKMGENDRCAIITFEYSSHLVQELSSDKQLLKDKINSITANGGTCIAPGITDSVKQLIKEDSSRSKYIFVYSDGEDSFNQVNQIKEASTFALMNHIRIFTLTIGNPNRHMQMVALNSRGIYRLAPSEDDIAEIMDMFATEVFDTAGRSITFKTTVADRSLIDTNSIVPAPQKIRENSDGSVTLEWKISRLSMTDTQTISLPLTYSGEEQGVKDIIRDTSCVYYDNTGYASVLYGEDLTLNIDKYHTHGTWSAVFDGKTQGIRWKNIYWNGLRPDDGKIEVTASCSNDGQNFGEPVPVTNNVNLQGLSGRYIRISAVLRASSTGKTPELHDITVKSEGCDVPQNGSAAPFIKIRSKGTVRAGVPLNLRAEITDECSGDNLSVNWSSKDNAAIFEKTTGLITSITFSQPGTYEVTCTVNDGLHTNSTTAQIEVIEGDIYSNLDPDARIPSPSPETHTELPATVGFRQTVSGQIELLNDADVSWYGMLLSDGTVANVQRDGSFSFVTGYSAKLVTVSVYAFNWDGDYTVKEYTISITDNQPSLEVNVSEDRVGQGSTSPYFEVATVLPKYIKADTYKYTLNGKELPVTQIVQSKYYLPTNKTGDYTFRVTAEATTGQILTAEKTISVCPMEISIELNSEKDTYHIGDSVSARVNVSYSSNNYTATLTANGNEVALNNLGEGVFTPSTVGKYELTAEVTDDYGNSASKTITIKVIDPSNTLVPQVTITSPSSDDEIYKPTDIIGTVTSEGLLYYVLEYSPAGKDEYQTLSEGETAVNNAVLGKLDPTVLQNGKYDIRLTGYGSNGSNSDTVTVTVEGEMKIGNYSVSFIDTEVPLLNLPLTVNRTYDSRMKNTSGDFGYGWEMNITDSLKLEENRVQGDGWTLVIQSNFLLNIYRATETKEHIIKVRWGNGRVDEFEMIIPDDITTFPIWDFDVAYKAKPGTTSKLEALGITEQYFLDSTDGLRTLDGKLYSPQRYRLTTEDGTEYIFDKDKGVEEIIDPKGNTVKFTQNGVIHSAGDGLTFERDAENRITKITSIAGEVTYSYNHNGDLISVTDLAGCTTRFEYDRNHYLTAIIDPRGVTVSRNEYDDNGRLIAVIDADGNRIEYNHDLDERKEIVKDRMGNITVYGYDEQGNVTSVTDPEGNTTRSTYDENGNLSTVTDPLGGITKYKYDEDGKIKKITAPDGREAKSTYDQKGRLLTLSSGNPESGESIVAVAMSYTSFGAPEKITDAEGNETNYMYNAEGNLSSVSDAIGKYLTVTYDSKGNVISTKNGEGATAIYTYDSQNRCISKCISRKNYSGSIESIMESYVYDNAGRVVKVIDGAGNTTSVEYNSIGKTAATIDERNNKTTYEYDNAGNTVKITYSDNTFETFEYDKEGRTTKAVNRAGRAVTMTYDKNGNLLTKTYPNGASETYAYDAKKRLVSATSVNGGVTTYEYDASDRNTAIVDALGNRTQFVYDLNTGALSEVIDANGNSVKYEYDNNGRQTKIILADKSEWCTEYDARGRVTVQKDAYGAKTVYTYDGADRLTSVTDALDNTYAYTYDETGSLTSVTDPNGYVTSYEYDRMGRATRVRNQDMPYNITRKYDAAGNITDNTVFYNSTIQYKYDSMNRVTRKSYGSGANAYTAEYAYTDDGLLSTVTDNSGTITYTYDEMNGLTGKTLQDGTKLAYTYDTACRLTSVSVYKPDGTLYGSTSYEYDLLDRPVKVTDKNGDETCYKYDAAGNRTEMTYPNGAKTQYTYDKVNRLTCEKVLDTNENIVAQYTYTLGANGERTGVKETGRTVEYTYDEIGRLTGEKETKGGQVTETLYEYDKNSNRTKKTVNGDATLYSYNSKNQLTSEKIKKGGTEILKASYSYNYTGHQTKKTEDSKTLNYTYDTENRLVRVTDASNANIEQYTYDWEGNRIQKISENGTVNYIVDTNCQYAQVIAETDENGNLLTWYTRGDELISLERAGEKRYYFYDGHGSVRMLADENNSVTDTYEFDAFGNLTARTGVTENAYLYCGEQFDALTGLYYLRARYMDPTNGRFTSMDSYAGALNDPITLHKYLYANANPVTFKDPSGNMGMAGYALTIVQAIGTASTIIRSAIEYHRYMNDGAGPEELLTMLLQSVLNTVIMWEFCLISAEVPVLGAILAAYGLANQLEFIIESIQNGDWVMVLVGILEFAGMVVGLYNTCFTGDTLVATEDGRRRIDEINVGDKVWAYNPDTGEKELKEVVNVFVKETDEILHLQTTDGNIDTTTTHPFYVVDEGWKAAGDLKAGDEIYALDGSAITILSTSLEKLDEPIKVYNLEVADFHTYFVGNTGMLVHNRCGGSGSKETGNSGAGSSDSGSNSGKDTSFNDGKVRNPLEDVRFTDKVKEQMTHGDYHGFPESVDAFGSSGTISTRINGDKTTVTWIEIPGWYKGKEGVFQYIIGPDGTCNHRFFVPN